jgi:hypothetical protein
MIRATVSGGLAGHFLVPVLCDPGGAGCKVRVRLPV